MELGRANVKTKDIKILKIVVIADALMALPANTARKLPRQKKVRL